MRMPSTRQPEIPSAAARLVGLAAAVHCPYLQLDSADSTAAAWRPNASVMFLSFPSVAGSTSSERAAKSSDDAMVGASRISSSKVIIIVVG